MSPRDRLRAAIGAPGSGEQRPYDDEYVRREGAWLIEKRVSHFTWRDREEMATPAR